MELRLCILCFFFPFCDIIDNPSSPKKGIKQSSAQVSPEAAESQHYFAESQEFRRGPRTQPDLLESSPGSGSLQAVGR